ncbi:SDR family oxidoreductase [Lysinibacter cavernae]|uniref:NAD(P)-dependent dehydrogenase (Short-subunit alcohol dehydrogenase family) n=1 Tax=Lysinibacter cavernae TaxID=1640652 RepID=A0A7X5R370_9MICO|nr:NAD(P)-dependent dehydrogenase (short-subunit alcohol dehydrogenase family) [Lysinibacter cavernae]
MDRRVSLVTGGASGIGLAVARRLRSEGDVVVVDTNTTTFGHLRDEGLTPIEADVTATGDWKALAAELVTTFGRLDYLVHNAGTAPIVSLRDATDEQLDLTYSTNVRSVLIGTRELWDLLVASQGSIVNIASVAALVGQDRSAGYVASKGAVLSATRALAIELAPFGVRVNSVCPGTTMTPMLERHFQNLPNGEEAQRQVTARHPIGRLLTPEDIVPSVLHLLRRELSGGMTGANIVVDGGLTATFDYGNSFAGGSES